MTEIEKIEYAKSFIDKLANSINPLDDSPIPGRISSTMSVCQDASFMFPIFCGR